MSKKMHRELKSRYRFVRELNKGGMGAVYEALDTVLDASVAIKENLISDPKMRDAFRREAQLLANLHHPALPYSIDLFSSGARQYLVMEFIEGDNLATMLEKRRAPFPVETVMDWAKQMLDVLEYLHEQNVLHRDIKPQNLKVTDGRVYLLDFGLAYGQSGEMNTIASGDFNWNCYTRKYSPIEQLRSERTCPASDIYSLAATLYKLLTNVAPADAADRYQRSLRGETDSLEDPRTYNKDVDERTAQAIMQALSLNMETRPQNVNEMRQMLFAHTIAAPVGSTSGKYKNPVLWSGTLGLCLLAGLLVVGPHLLGSRQAFGLPVHCAEQISDAKPFLSPTEQSARLSQEADLLHQSGKDDEAKKKNDEALALDPANIEANRLKGDLAWDAKSGSRYEADDREVKATANTILSMVSSPRTEKEFAATAWAELQKHHFDIAIRNAEAALRSNPDSVVALMIRASARIGRTRESLTIDTVKEALADLDRVIKLRPDYAQALVNRGDVHFRLQLFEQARDDYARAAELIPRPNYYLRLHLCLGDLYFQSQDWSQAEDAYVAANRILETWHAFSQLAIVYEKMGQSEKSASSNQRALDLATNDASMARLSSR